MRSLLPLALAVLTAVLAASGATAAGGRTVLLDISGRSDGHRSHLTFRLSDETDFRVQTLSAPDRLVIDLPPVDWLTLPAHMERVAARLSRVSSVRYGQFRPGTYRIVLDLSGPITVETPSLMPGGKAYALAVSWRPADTHRAQRFGTHASVPLPKARPAGDRNPAGDTRPLIVIDPGHGGVDPGAIGVGGTKEKDIVLQAAKLLAERLRASGSYRVVLTRETDRFLKLRERVAIARREKADLFLSLHANTAASAGAAGLSVFSLSEHASDRIAAELARRENKADIIAGVDLTEEPPPALPVLIDLARRENMNRSIGFANSLLKASAGRLPILRRAHRQAGFAVLKAPEVPSVLIEMGFLSNADEEALLNSPLHLNQITYSIAAAIDGFFAPRLTRRE